MVVEIEDDGQLAMICGDVLHQPFQITDPAIGHAGDADPALAARTRAALAERLAERDGVLLPAHFAPGQVVRADGGLVHRPV